MNIISKKGKNEGRNLKPEKSQDYAQKPQRNCKFMNDDGNRDLFIMYQLFSVCNPDLYSKHLISNENSVP
jgi:hypothetical protein